MLISIQVFRVVCEYVIFVMISFQLEGVGKTSTPKILDNAPARFKKESIKILFHVLQAFASLRGSRARIHPFGTLRLARIGVSLREFEERYDCFIVYTQGR